jgi:hypothetical protein
MRFHDRSIPPVTEGLLRVRVRDEAGKPLPARLTFVGVNGTLTPRFTRSDFGRDQPGGVLAYDRGFLVGDAELAVPVGQYDVWVSHGPEWEALAERVRVERDEATRLDVTLRHLVPTPGWISGDFHVHAERSPDSRVSMRHRVEQFVADGVDLIVSTDHNTITDYGPTIAELGLTDRLASLRGSELTTHDWGHFGAFPFAADTPPIPVGDHTPAQIFAEVRAAAPGAIIDVHHPRLEHGRMGYFHLGKLDLATMHSHRAGFSFDFDAVEVLNGYQDPDRASVDAVLEDWFALLRRGHRVTATGNSDSHHLTFNLGGYPRNYVRVREAQLDGATLADAIRAGRSFFTTGPIVEVTAGPHGLGDTVHVRGPLALTVRVQAPAWIDVDMVTVLVDGHVALRRPVIGAPPVRFAETLSIPIERDGFIVVRVDGGRAMSPVLGDGDRFRVFPFAVTNPIWVDVDGDGEVTPSVR